MDYSRYIRFDGAEFGSDWGVYEFPDGQVQIWFSEGIAVEQMEVCINHPAIVDLLGQAHEVIGPVDFFVTYLYGARSDKTANGDRRVPNVAERMRGLLATLSASKQLQILVPHDSQENAAPFTPAIDLTEYEGIVFPDASACGRQPWLDGSGLPSVTFEKVRDQVTGEIMGLALTEPVPGKRLLVVDDICDGGTTFIKVAEQLPGCSLDLSVVHGVFSGNALDRLSAAGYGRIYCTNSYVHHDADLAELVRTRCQVYDVWNCFNGNPVRSA